MADEQAPAEPPPEPSWRERLRQLDEEDERAAEAEVKARLAAREAARKAPLTVPEAPPDTGRGERPLVVGRPLERGSELDAAEALGDERQRALRQMAAGEGIRYR
jgi:hypothetical protein